MLKRIRDRLGGALSAFGRALPEVARQGVVLGSIGLIAYGAWQVFPPAGFIAGGGLLLAGAVLAAK